MTPYERIKAAFSFQKTDRIPRYEIFLPDFVSKFYEESGLPSEISIYDFYDKIDIGAILTDQEGPFFLMKKIEKQEGDTLYERDSWGRLLLKKKDAFFEQEIEAILKDKKDVDLVNFESPLLEERYLELRKFTEVVKKRFAPVTGILGLYMGCFRMRGQEQFLIDLAEDKEFCRYLVNKLKLFTKELAVKVAEETQTWDTALWVYDEFSSRLGPMFSPKTFEEIFMPAYKEMIGYWKSKGIKNIVLHCDGNSLPLLDLIIECGFTGIQSLAPTAGMWLPDVKKKYGNKLVLIGGMCNMETLANGSFEDIRRQAEAVVEVARDGGVIVGTHSIDVDIPLKNYDYYYSVMNTLDRIW